ncbi:expansin EXLX1 family cellulose-binding protein [Streptomyces sp. 1331.2]|uniref:expansin EXLX1 family cellulose-binding protein n=1 Tax=Streptomyces sp. 1331.2 TaxID=1938835 RepID=UPI000BD5E30B|nr:expansin EXLX1 family cellulose-binding protein [Streptomyces sp. 1331.2]SOB86045.1 Peptidoglycan-binding domain-containing protein, expansin [Streptomyces sp. 1331.2]
MKATKHAAPPPNRRRGLGPVLGIPLALVAVGVLVCLAFALLPGGGGGTGAAEPAAASVAATEPSTPAATGALTDPTPSAASPSAAGATPSATVTPSPSATPTPKPSAPGATTAGRAGTSPSAAQAAADGAGSGSGSAQTTASLAGRIKPGTNYQGVATSYDAADGNGACSFGPSADLMVAAMNHTDYETSRACGATVLVRAANGASITVRIVNECPLPCAPGQLDLSHEAFAKLADLSVGRLPITWTELSPGSAPAAVSIRYKTGSSQWWCGIQAIGHRNPVATLEVRAGGGWRQLTRTDYNYFLSPDGSGCGGSIRVTDVYGEQLTVDGLAVKPDVVQPTHVQFARH